MSLRYGQKPNSSGSRLRGCVSLIRTMSSSREKRRTTVCRLRLIPRVLLALFLPVAAVAQQSPDSARGDSGRLELHPSWDEREEYRTGARISDQLVARGERAGLRISPAAGPLGLVGQL